MTWHSFTSPAGFVVCVPSKLSCLWFVVKFWLMISFLSGDQQWNKPSSSPLLAVNPWTECIFNDRPMKTGKQTSCTGTKQMNYSQHKQNLWNLTNNIYRLKLIRTDQRLSINVTQVLQTIHVPSMIMNKLTLNKHYSPTTFFFRTTLTQMITL